MPIPVVDVHVCPMDQPSDVSALQRLFDTGRLDAKDIVAIVGKTEGTGLGDDVERATVDSSLRTLISRQLGINCAEVSDRLCLILSGGTPGVITPHIAVIARRWIDPDPATSPTGTRLVVGQASSPDILPEEIGRMGQIGKVADAVRLAMHDAGLKDAADVHAVLVKAPALTDEGIVAATARGHGTVTRDLSLGPEGAMCYSNDASALGVALATGEVSPGALHDNVVRRDFALYSDVAFTSSAGEKRHAEVVVLGNRAGAGGNLRIGHSSMRDILDINAVRRALLNASLTDPYCREGRPPSRDEELRPPDQDLGPLNEDLRSRVVYVLTKMIIPSSDRLHGHRITLLDDPVGYHVAKAMGGFMLAATTGRTTAFVSGGERNSHQGPPDGNPLAAIVRAG